MNRKLYMSVNASVHGTSINIYYEETIKTDWLDCFEIIVSLTTDYMS